MQGDGPNDPSQEECKGDAMAGLVVEVGDDLWYLCYSPAEEADHTEAKR